MDEVGRGAWAGPFVACALLADRGERIVRGVRDSKLLTPTQRQQIASTLKERHQFAIGIVTVDELNIIGLARAQVVVFERAIEELKSVILRAPPKRGREAIVEGSRLGSSNNIVSILIDGRPMRTHPEWHSIIDGDDKEYSIAAASIIAKVARDTMMEELHAVDDRYRFDLHKGYGTALHQRLLEKCGVSPFHRRLFLPIKNML